MHIKFEDNYSYSQHVLNILMRYLLIKQVSFKIWYNIYIYIPLVYHSNWMIIDISKLIPPSH